VIENSKGQRFFGMHFYPGVAQYSEDGKEPYRVFLNEDTITAMDASFEGKPVFVMHVDEVEQSLDKLRGEADGWVVRSFYNAPDGKHWCEFMVVSERGLRAIKQGMKLSNCYMPKSFGSNGLWNGVSYSKEIKGGEYEHLAIVPNPRYEESVIMAPDEFKKYNDDRLIELKRLANDKSNGKGLSMKLQLFKKAKVENDLSELSVILPKSGREVTITQMVNEADEKEVSKDMNAGMADLSHKVKLADGSHCNVGELVEKHKLMCDELEAMKKDALGEAEEKEEPKANEEGKEEPKENDEDEDAKKKALELAAHEDKEIKEAKAKNAKEKADRLANAHLAPEETATVDLSEDKVARGRTRYGS